MNDPAADRECDPRRDLATLVPGADTPASLRRTTMAGGDLGPVPPAFHLADSFNEFAYRGFRLHPDGKSFLTSVLKVRMQIDIMKDFSRRPRLADTLLSTARQ